MRHGRVKDAASYETVTHSHPCAGQRHPVRHGGTRRCRPTYSIRSQDETHCPAALGRIGTQHIKKAAVHHPHWGGDGGLRLRRGLRHLRMALWDAWGVSPAAAGGCFAPCAARPGRCPWTPRFFEKKSSKTFVLGCDNYRMINAPFSTSTVRWAPGSTSPERIRFASSVSTVCWTYRRRGRAPNAGS